MIHKALLCGLTTLALGAFLVVSSSANAVTFELRDIGGGSYDAIMTTEAGDEPIFAVDMFILGTDGAVVMTANNNGNPYDEPTANDMPPGNPGAILIGGSDISGACATGGNNCFGNFQCGGGDTCVFGQTGEIKLGEITWDGSGTLSLRINTTAVDGTLQEQPISNLSGCFALDGTEVLAGADSWPLGGGNGIPNACECGDSNGDGTPANADLVLAFQCIATGDPMGTMEPCATRIHKGDTNDDDVLANGDLVRTFTSINSGDSTGNVCRARPN